MSMPDNTLVDFYILHEQSQRSIMQFCCRLTEKAWKLGNTIRIRTNNPEETHLLDDLLWTYSSHSFLPHTTQQENTDTPVIIGHDINNQTCDLLINLATNSPDNIRQYPRIAEILNDDDTIKQNGRIRYTQYKQSGCSVKHHEIASK